MEKIKKIEYIFWSSLTSLEGEPDYNIECVMFEYIDKGIMDVHIFANFVITQFPNVKSVFVNQNYTNTKNRNYTFEEMYNDLNLDLLVVMAQQQIDDKQISHVKPLKKNGILAYLYDPIYDYNENEEVYNYVTINKSNDFYMTDDLKLYLTEAVNFFSVPISIDLFS